MFSVITGASLLWQICFRETGVSFPYPGEQNQARLFRAIPPDRVKVVYYVHVFSHGCQQP